MNKLQESVLVEIVTRRVMKMNYICPALCEALSCTENNLEDGIMEFLNDEAYIQDGDLRMEISNIDIVLRYAKEKDLDMSFGFSSILESFVVSGISEVINIDLLEWM